MICFMTDILVNTSQNVDSSVDQREAPAVVSFNHLQVFVEFLYASLDAIVLGYIPVTNEKLESFLVLCVAKLEHFNRVVFLQKGFYHRPFHICEVELNCFLLSTCFDSFFLDEPLHKVLKQMLVVVSN